MGRFDLVPLGLGCAVSVPAGASLPIGRAEVGLAEEMRVSRVAFVASASAAGAAAPPRLHLEMRSKNAVRIRRSRSAAAADAPAGSELVLDDGAEIELLRAGGACFALRWVAAAAPLEQAPTQEECVDEPPRGSEGGAAACPPAPPELEPEPGPTPGRGAAPGQRADDGAAEAAAAIALPAAAFCSSAGPTPGRKPTLLGRFMSQKQSEKEARRAGDGGDGDGGAAAACGSGGSGGLGGGAGTDAAFDGGRCEGGGGACSTRSACPGSPLMARKSSKASRASSSPVP